MTPVRERADAAGPPPPRTRRRGVLALVGRTLAQAWRHRIFGMSAETGFWQLLSLPPLLLGTLGVIGFFADDLPRGTIKKIQDAILSGASNFIAPDAVESLLKPSLHAVLSGGRADVVSIGFILSLWSGSSALATYVNTISIAYDMRDIRSAVRARLLAVVMYIGAVVIGVVVLPLLVIGPDAIVSWAPTAYRGAVGTLVRVVYWPVISVVCVLLIATLYHVAVPVRKSWRRALPGSVFAMALWVAGAFLLRLYITNVFSRLSVYGSLASPVAVLLFFYITALAVLVGAELNAEIERTWPHGRGAERPPLAPAPLRAADDASEEPVPRRHTG